MSWLSRLNPRGPGARSSRTAVSPSPVTADPETCLMVFENHWRQLSWVLERDSSGSGAGDDLTTVRNHTDQMLCLLAEERLCGTEGGANASAMGPILQLLVSQNILERVVQWHLRRGLDADSQGALLKLFEMLMGRSQQPLLQHRALLQPLLLLLAACTECPPVLEPSLVLLLNQVCVCMARQPTVLELLFQSPPASQGPTNLLIFSLLVPFIHRDGAIGQQARDALLLVMATSADNHTVAQYIAENSYFCPVLATGLSALYSSLPRKIEARGDDWHALRREDWAGVASLVLFMNSLEFCNAVVQVAHPLVRCQLLDYVHNGFLVPVMGPALHKSSVEEMIASTAYLDLFLRSITEAALLKTFLRFILLHRHDNDTILDTLLIRINSNSRLCMVSLGLFRTLLSLNCEDLMLQLVLRYLIPCTHVMLSQRRAIRETDMYGKSADKFLSLIPECCRSDSLLCERDDEPACWGKVPGSPGPHSPGHPRPSTPSRLALFIRQQSTGAASPSPSSPDQHPQSPTSMPSAPLSPESPTHHPTDWRDWEAGYLEYLREARRGIELCSWACRNWSAPYDGENPSPSSVPVPVPVPALPVSVCPELVTQRSSAASARSDWGSSERDSGEWDVTISKNCISLTPRTKKRSLQQEEEPVKPVAPPPPCPLPPSTHLSSAPPTGTPLALYNGGMEVKKVRRDSGQNGMPEHLRDVPGEEVDALKLAQVSQNGRGPVEKQEGVLSPVPHEPQLSYVSVESLMEELLQRVPSAGESNGQGISIEAFRQELRELEDRVQGGMGSAGETPPPSARPHSPADTEPSTEESKQADGTCVSVFSPRTLTQPPVQPYTGPFMAVVLAKLENMLHNSLYVNILLTGIVARLACYPQPLLRSFLLNANMVFQPCVKSLIQVLGTVKNRIEAFAATQEDFVSMLRKARRYLVARGKLDWSDSPLGIPTLRRSDSLVKSRKPSLGELLLRHTNSPTRARQAAQMALAHVRDGALFRGGTGVEKQAEVLRVKNAVYATVIFSEFVKELAALAQEHAVAVPFSHSHQHEE